MSQYEQVLKSLADQPKTWLITGVAGFIGSNLLEALLRANQKVIGLDNFATGKASNLQEVENTVGQTSWANFRFIEGDIQDEQTCFDAAQGVDYVLHQAALGSVPRSIDNPLASHNANVNGFLNMLMAAKEHKVEQFVYAASSSTYGDSPILPKQEDVIGNPLSPYAATKLIDEIYARVFWLTYGRSSVGLRYFNVFGRRQDPDGAYAAVIPLWFKALLTDDAPKINGDGETSRDFCYIENVIQANILAATTPPKDDGFQVFNVAFGEATSLNQLFELIKRHTNSALEPIYRDFRAGDVRHSLADISKARDLIGYEPKYSIRDGLDDAAQWYRQYFAQN